MMRKNLRFLALAGAVVCAVGVGQQARASITITAPTGGPDAIVFDEVTFTGPNWFYVGGSDSGANLPKILAAPTYGLSRTDFQRVNGSWGTPALKGITPQNCVQRNDVTTQTKNPLNSLNAGANAGVPVTNMTQVNQLPLATRPIPWTGSDMSDATAPALSKGTIVYETLPGNAGTINDDGSTIGCLNTRVAAGGIGTSFTNEPYRGIAAQPSQQGVDDNGNVVTDAPWGTATAAWTVGVTEGFGVYPFEIDSTTGNSLVSFPIDTTTPPGRANPIPPVHIALTNTDQPTDLLPVNEYTGRVTNLAWGPRVPEAVVTIDNTGVAMWADPMINKVFVGMKNMNGIQFLLGGKVYSAASLLVAGKKAVRAPGEAQNSVVVRHSVDLQNIPSVTDGGKAWFDAAGYKNIVGIVDSGVGDLRVSGSAIYNIRTMHTSTGRSYVIINGGSGLVADITNGTRQINMYALPIVARKLPEDTNPGYVGFDDNGLIAKKNGVNATIAADTDVFAYDGADSRKIIIGVDPTYISIPNAAANNATQVINDIAVVGDTVYVAMGTNTDDVNYVTNLRAHIINEGIFASTALFDEQGRIAGWTPWQRLTGDRDTTNKKAPAAVAKVFVDPSTQNVWSLSYTGTNVRVTEWYGETDVSSSTSAYKTPGANDGALFTALPHDSGIPRPIYGVFDFDGRTTGFVPVDNATKWEKFSMMVVTGNGWVSMVQTGRWSDNTLTNPGYFIPDRAFAANTNVFNFTASTVLQSLGNIVTAEVARVKTTTNNNNAGWLFVGGDNGLAVFCKTADGTGWDSSTGLSLLNPLGYPGDANTYSWKLLTSPSADIKFANIRKITADDRGNLYVLTRDALYRIGMDLADIAAGTINAANITTLVDLRNQTIGTTVYGYDGITPQTYLDKNADELFDFMILQSQSTANIALVGTTQGVVQAVYVDAAAGPADVKLSRIKLSRYDSATATEVVNSAKNLVFGPALKLSWMGGSKGDPLQDMTNGLFRVATGNVQILALSADWKDACIYRLVVDLTSQGALYVQGIDERKYIDDGTGNYQIPVDYFYKIGSFDPSVGAQFSFVGPTDLIGTNAIFGGGNLINNINGMTRAVQPLPQPNLFINFVSANPAFGGGGSDTRPYDVFAIDMKRSLTDLSQLGGQPVLNSAGGIPYVFGQFGMIENS